MKLGYIILINDETLLLQLATSESVILLLNNPESASSSPDLLPKRLKRLSIIVCPF
jgi:hypothetical protein